MALIHIWGWRNEPDEETARRLNSAALDELCEKYLELFPNEHVQAFLGVADAAGSKAHIDIIVDCSFGIELLRPKRKKRIERELVEVFWRHFPDWTGTVKATLR